MHQAHHYSFDAEISVNKVRNYTRVILVRFVLSCLLEIFTISFFKDILTCLNFFQLVKQSTDKNKEC